MVVRMLATLCVLLLVSVAQVGAVVLVDIPLDAQINGSAIYVPAGLNGSLSFQPANPPSEPSGWCHNSVGPGWYYGPYVDLTVAGIGNIDVSDPSATLQVDCRFYQGGENTNPYGDAPIFLRLYSFSDAGKTVGGYRDYGIFYATQSATNTAAGQVGLDAQYPIWTAESVPLNASALWTYTDGPIGGGTFNPAAVSRLRFYGTDWLGQGQDFIDFKNLKITAVPEPGSIVALLAGLFGLAPLARRKK